MRSFLKQLRFFITDTWQSRGSAIKVESSLAKAAKDATSIGESKGMVSGFTGGAADAVTNGHEHYAKSLEKRERPR